mmetsp:Transcript_11796/g.22745  ORF Transcript_11796/g.22745 Transcript_11796/m.22745 type:complete len:126 (-) Transcript_11796:55-432(-)
MLKILLQTYPDAAQNNLHGALDSLRPSPASSAASSRVSSSNNLNSGSSRALLSDAGCEDQNDEPDSDEVDECRRLMTIQLLQTRINLYTWSKMSPFGSRAGPGSSGGPALKLQRDARAASCDDSN